MAKKVKMAEMRFTAKKKAVKPVWIRIRLYLCCGSQLDRDRVWIGTLGSYPAQSPRCSPSVTG